MLENVRSYRELAMRMRLLGVKTPVTESFYSGIDERIMPHVLMGLESMLSGGMTDFSSCTVRDCMNSFISLTICRCDYAPEIPFDDDILEISEMDCVEIKDGATSITGCAFYDCEHLKRILIPTSVKNIGTCAFHGCSGLTNVTIPDSVTSIGSRAFAECVSLRHIEIKGRIEYIGNDAFLKCQSLEKIECPGMTMDEVEELEYYPWGARKECICAS